VKLERYDAARKALAEATRVDDVKEIHNQALAMQVYAKQAKDGVLISRATEIRKRAERRIGELMEEERKAGTLKRGGTRKGSKVASGPLIALAKRGIDKHLADRSRKLAAMPKDKFEATVAKASKIAVAATEGNTSVIREARAERHEAKKARRQTRMRELVKKNAALPLSKFGVILADPEWQYEVRSEKGLDRAAANHYTTSDIDAIKQRDVQSIAADDCVLFLWVTVPLLPEGIETMASWGFDYKSNFVWVKDKTGTGYWNRNQHELLLVGTRGKIPAPLEGTQWSSVINAKRGRHSEKPDVVYRLIEDYYPDMPKIELNARKRRDGWDVWGNESEAA
jgi:N6-adenosine-specific RNA methylase IME4